MAVYVFHGDRCSRAPTVGMHQPAVHHSMCLPCWLGASERQRRLALFVELVGDPPAVDPLGMLADAVDDAYH